MILYHKKYNKKYAKAIKDKRIIVRSSCYPNKHIVDFSHYAIPISSQNPHYGIHGDYYEASHIEDNIKKKQFILYGEHSLLFMSFHNILFKLKWARYQYQRLSFNPDFPFLIEQIKQFIVKIE